MNTALETERLTLRPMTPGDVDALAAVLGDPEAMRYYPAPFSRDKVEGWIQWSVKNYADFGYGLWAVVLKASQECIGDCGLTWQRVGYAAERQLEVGWHIRRDLWNRGLATEAGIVCRDYARDVIRQPHLISIIGGRKPGPPKRARRPGGGTAGGETAARER